MAKFPDFRLWYIGHIILLVAVAFIGGHYLQDYICRQYNYCIEQFVGTQMILANLIYYSILAWIFDSAFHAYTGLD